MRVIDCYQDALLTLMQLLLIELPEEIQDQVQGGTFIVFADPVPSTQCLMPYLRDPSLVLPADPCHCRLKYDGRLEKCAGIFTRVGSGCDASNC